MDTEFEKLMRLAEKTTLDIQRDSLDRKRATSAKGPAVIPTSREEQEKRRRVELERRVRQREEEERQRQIRARESLERRRQERVEAERADEVLRQKRKHAQKVQQNQGQTMRQHVPRSAPAKRVGHGFVASAESKRTTHAAPLSYSELMRIASGKPAAHLPSLSKDRALEPQRLPSEPKRPHRTDGPVKSPPLPAASLSRPRQQTDTSRSVRRSAPPPRTTKPFVHAESASRTSAPKKQKASAVPIQQERRLPPEREIDRFGVIPRSTAKRGGNPVRAVPYPLPESSSARRRNTRDGPAAAPTRLDPRDRRDPAPCSATPHARQRNTSHTSRQQIPASRPIKPSEPKRTHASRHDDYDDDSEYDSMDDFVVDDEGGYRVGSIREMFGVRYHDVNDDDDDDMEVSAMQQMREDKRSARIGRLEDDAEERRLAEEERERERRRRTRERR
ncbi:hypothetical protein LPJ59_003286 [Coemansia sp. RSA 2399]|nr:hypothetical protein LPJ59_003286 [Coemansia sp. RSA 2399]KAJ1902238.1 hypothetical protein LPJ81_003625 [Coemansia sp. IMI 209127]